MKIILAGATGFIGSEVLTQCLRNPAIDSIVVLSRRPLSDTISADASKVEVIVMKDFKVYPDEVVKQMEGADACIWYLHLLRFRHACTKILSRSMGTTEAIPELEIEYPLAFARAFAPTLAGQGKPFRYMHTSGVLAERDQSKSLLFLSEGRRTKVSFSNLAVPYIRTADAGEYRAWRKTR